MKTAGIIGGMSPHATARFYLKIIDLCRAQEALSYPSLVIYNPPLYYGLERDIVEKNKRINDLFPVLLEAIRRLESSGVDFILLPCNTAHFFIEKLREKTSLPIISIIEEVGRRCEVLNFRTVGILGTRKTIEERLYQKELEKRKIKSFVLDTGDQQKFSRAIYEILKQGFSQKLKEEISETIRGLEKGNVDCVLLGCTDLILQKDFSLPVIDSLEVLAEAGAKRLLDKN